MEPAFVLMRHTCSHKYGQGKLIANLLNFLFLAVQAEAGGVSADGEGAVRSLIGYGIVFLVAGAWL